jgi:hypothetical protein
MIRHEHTSAYPGEFVITHLKSKSGAIAMLTERGDRNPIRPVATGRRNRPVGTFPSIKCGRAIPWESYAELHAIYLAEVDTNVLHYRSQPHTLRVSGSLRAYTPDLELTLSDGSIEIVEVKSQRFDLLTDDYTSKLSAAENFYDTMGWKFRQLDMSKVVGTPHFEAVSVIQSYRRTMVTTSDTFLISKLFACRSTLPMWELTDAYPHPVGGLAKACAMIVRRMISVDCFAGLDDTSTVRLVAQGVR